jgi:fructokinase
MTRRLKILSCGEVLWDLFPEGPRFGGAPANFACHAALLGADAIMLSAVGDDDRGAEALSILAGIGVDTALIQQIPGAATGTVGVVTDGAGKPSYEIHAGSAWDSIAWSKAIEQAVDSAGAVYFGTLGQRGPASRATIRRALELARERGIPRILDVNLRAPFFDDALIRDSIALASVLKLSDEELPHVAKACGLGSNDETDGTNPATATITASPDGQISDASTEAVLRALLERYRLTHVAMTRGAEGALLLSSTETVSQPGIPTIVRDTVGAGDSFTAALALGLLRRDPLANIALTACQTASAVCAQDGAVPLTAVTPS